MEGEYAYSPVYRINFPGCLSFLSSLLQSTTSSDIFLILPVTSFIMTTTRPEQHDSDTTIDHNVGDGPVAHRPARRRQEVDITRPQIKQGNQDPLHRCSFPAILTLLQRSLTRTSTTPSPRPPTRTKSERERECTYSILYVFGFYWLIIAICTQVSSTSATATNIKAIRLSPSGA